MITLCVTIPVILGGVVVDETVALVNIDMPVIRSIQEDVKTKNTTILYHSGQSQNINIPFTVLINLLKQQQQFVVYNAPKILKISPNMVEALKPQPQTLEKTDNTIRYGYQPDTNHGRDTL